MVHDSRFDKKADRIMEFVLKTGNMGHNRDMSHFSKQHYLIRKCVSMGRRIGDLINHARIFPLNSLRFFPSIMWNGMRSAMRGEKHGDKEQGDGYLFHRKTKSVIINS